MAELTTLTAAIYRRYKTTPAPGYENTTPGITSRFEVFQDDQVPNMKVRMWTCALVHIWLLDADLCRSTTASSNSPTCLRPI